MRPIFALLALLAAPLALATQAVAQQPLQITITDGVIEPVPIAVPTFEAETAGAEQLAADISRLIVQDLVNTGLFREVPASAFISEHSSFAQTVAFNDWRAINVTGLVTGAVAVSGDQLVVKFRLHDVFAGAELGQGVQFAGTVAGWRRMAHKVADAVYSRVTGKRAISTAASSSCPNPGPRTTGSSGWRSWITTAPTSSS
jgi:TolB protein